MKKELERIECDDSVIAIHQCEQQLESSLPPDVDLCIEIDDADSGEVISLNPTDAQIEKLIAALTNALAAKRAYEQELDAEYDEQPDDWDHEQDCEMSESEVTDA